jgi:twitching motility two-component system response regulator PilH
MSLVLVVDDSVMAREMLVHELERNGFQVMTATDGMEAVEQLKHRLPAIVITDLIMPRMNGYELCRHIKTDCKNVPVIMCSTKGEDFDRYWGMKQGADAYITKPYQPKDMINAVKYLLEEAGHYNEDTVGF